MKKLAKISASYSTTDNVYRQFLDDWQCLVPVLGQLTIFSVKKQSKMGARKGA